MSFRKENPLKKPEPYSDFSAQFGRNRLNNDVVRLTDLDAVKRSIKNLILTDKYERLLDPRIGAGIRALLFEPMTPLVTISIRDTISNTLATYEPRAIVDQIDVQPDYERQSYYVTIIFSIQSTEQVGTVEFFLNRIR